MPIFQVVSEEFTKTGKGIELNNVPALGRDRRRMAQCGVPPSSCCAWAFFWHVLLRT
jgi:hypothetical protein